MIGNKMIRILIFTVVICLTKLLIGCDVSFSSKSKRQSRLSSKMSEKNLFTLDPLDTIKGVLAFNIELKDTLILGYNKGRILDYEKRNDNDDCLLSVIIENEYSDGVIRKDTFSDGSLSPWFGVCAFKKGLKKIKGAVLEEILTESDSAVHIAQTYHYFSLNVYVGSVVN